jgi:phosphatidylserine/phosphatidylglycerophosphate/cardiolipin synthase-like enzyme
MDNKYTFSFSWKKYLNSVRPECFCVCKNVSRDIELPILACSFVPPARRPVRRLGTSILFSIILFLSCPAILCADPVGRTHFVISKSGEKLEGVGMPPMGAVPRGTKHEIPAPSKNSRAGTYVFFSPDDDIRGLLLGMIKKEQDCIKIAMFNFTESKIADALADAHKRGVHVELIVDPSCLRSHKNKIGVLARKGIQVFVYNAEQSSAPNGWTSCMHNKFAIFGKNALNRPCVWTGSFNFTRSAGTNQENVVVLEDVHVVKKFDTQFEKLKERCQSYGVK